MSAEEARKRGDMREALVLRKEEEGEGAPPPYRPPPAAPNPTSPPHGSPLGGHSFGAERVPALPSSLAAVPGPSGALSGRGRPLPAERNGES